MEIYYIEFIIAIVSFVIGFCSCLFWLFPFGLGAFMGFCVGSLSAFFVSLFLQEEFGILLVSDQYLLSFTVVSIILPSLLGAALGHALLHYCLFYLSDPSTRRRPAGRGQKDLVQSQVIKILFAVPEWNSGRLFLIAKSARMGGFCAVAISRILLPV